MNHPAFSVAPQSDGGMKSPTIHVEAETVSPCRDAADEVRSPNPTYMTDEEREAAAYRAGCAMQAWYSQYQQTGDQKHLDRAYHHLGQMRQILAGRSAETVARMEAERGLGGR